MVLFSRKFFSVFTILVSLSHIVYAEDFLYFDNPRMSESFLAKNFVPRLQTFINLDAPEPPKVIQTHALSLMGDVKYPKNFKHFDYVNPNAPKGGEIILSSASSFDTLNSLNGKGDPAPGLKLIYDSLITGSLDEPASEYGLLAEKIRYSTDFRWVEYDIRAEAKWQDGTPITPEDVIFSLELLKTKGDPAYRYYYANVKKSIKKGKRTVRFEFDKEGNRELPQIVGQLPILPKHYWEKHDFTRSSLERPLSSGPYQVGAIVPNRSITFVRDPNYWAKDLPVNRGMYNFDKVRFEMYRDSTVQFEAFKSGGYDYRPENSAKNWALGYNFPDVKKGLVKKATFRNLQPKPMQGLVFNLRKPRFQRDALRQALALTFDFHWLNHNLFFDSYRNTRSFFEQSELASSDKITKAEKEIMESYVPPISAVFDEVPDEYNFRQNIRKALRILKEAGYKHKNGFLLDENGQTLKLEILNYDPFFERVLLPIASNMRKIGVDASIRTVDSAQYMRRLQKFDYDMVMSVYAQSSSPGNEQREFWGSAAADIEGSRNYAGLKDPVVDDLIENLVYAKSRKTLVATTKVLDRVLRQKRILIPLWYSPEDRIAYRDKFDFPKIEETYGAGGQINLWWRK